MSMSDILVCPSCGHRATRREFAQNEAERSGGFWAPPLPWALTCPLCTASTLPVDLERRKQFTAADFKTVEPKTP